MFQGHWLVNLSKSKIKRFIKEANIKGNFFEYLFIEIVKKVGILGKPPLMHI